MLGNYLFNEAAESVTGNRVVFDPINAMVDALSEDEVNAGTIAGRMAGEIGSNIPGGNVLSSVMFDENTRRKYFGNADPARFGTGVVLPVITKGGSAIIKAAGGENIDNLMPDLLDVGSKLLPPFGGAQAKKTIQGLQSLRKGGVYGKTQGEETLKFPIAKTPENKAKSILFGQYSTPEAREYFDKNRRPLSAKQTEQVKMSIEPKSAYERLMTVRKIDTIKNKIKEVNTDRKLTESQKEKKLSGLYQQWDELRNNTR
jgi:hypothetical protein